MHDPIREDISTTRHLGHGGAFAGVENMIWETFLPHIFSKKQIPLTHRRISKYHFGQEILVGTPESSDVRKIKLLKFSVSKWGTNFDRYWERSVLQRWPSSRAQERKA